MNRNSRIVAYTLKCIQCIISIITAYAEKGKAINAINNEIKL
jgi:hypothetical protein